ncbi:hypothetical protein Vafri_12648, partial [Volvox africanus]
MLKKETLSCFMLPADFPCKQLASWITARWLFLYILCFQVFSMNSSSAIARGGFVCITSDLADSSTDFSDERLYPSLFRAALEAAPMDADGIITFGDYAEGSATGSQFRRWVTAAGFSASTITYVTDPAKVTSYNLSHYKLLYIPEGRSDTSGGMTDALNDALIGIKDQVNDFVNNRGGSLIVRAQNALSKPYFFLATPLTTASGSYSGLTFTEEMAVLCPVCKDRDKNLDDYYVANYFTGPMDWGGLRVVAHITNSCPVPYGHMQDCKATVLCNTKTEKTAEDCNDEDDNHINGQQINNNGQDCWSCGANKSHEDHGFTKCTSQRLKQLT